MALDVGQASSTGAFLRSIIERSTADWLLHSPPHGLLQKLSNFLVRRVSRLILTIKMFKWRTRLFGPLGDYPPPRGGRRNAIAADDVTAALLQTDDQLLAFRQISCV